MPAIQIRAPGSAAPVASTSKPPAALAAAAAAPFVPSAIAGPSARRRPSARLPAASLTCSAGDGSSLLALRTNDLPPAFAPRPFVPSQPPGPPPIGRDNGLSDAFHAGLDLHGRPPLAPPYDPFASLQHPSPMPPPQAMHGDDMHLPAGFDPTTGGMIGLGSDPYYNGPRHDTHTQKQPLLYHLYAPPLPHVSAHHPQQIARNAFFMSPTLREDLQRRNEAIWQGLGPGEGAEIGGFWGLYPLDTPPAASGKDGGPATANVFGHRSWVYKAGSEVDGKCYVLRRLEDFRLQSESALGMVERWRRVKHPGVVGVREAFTTRGFGDHSIVFVYDYHPTATTLLDAHLTPKPPVMRNGRLQPHNMQVTERTLWSYIVQLTGAIKAVHSAGLACRTITVSKVLVTGANRCVVRGGFALTVASVRINACSMLDVIRNDEAKMATLQQDDFFDFGKLIVTLACSSLAAGQNLPRSLEHIGRQYSTDVQKVVLYLFGKPSPTKSIDELVAMIAPRMLDDLSAAQSHTDLLEDQLMREIENGRLVRLLCKFGFVNERPEFDHDPRWSETGDRYVIKLFRDYIFHQVDERGRPVLDLSHVLTCLNKLDAGVDERVTLTSRDSQSCLVVSYREVKTCINTAFQSLAK